MNLNDSSAAKAGASVVSFIASATAGLRQFAIYSAATFSSAISGAFGIVKNGPGSLAITVNNTYSGGTFVNAGTLTISTANGLGSGTATINGGALTVSFGSVGYLFANSLTGIGTVNLTAANGTGIVTPFFQPASIVGFSGTVTIDTSFNNIYYQINPNAGTTFNGSAAKWIVSNQNANSFAYTTASLVQFGELSGNGKVSCRVSLGSTLEVGALGTNSTFSGILLNNPFSGTLAFSKVGTGTLTLSGINTYTGGTTVNAGTLQVGNRTNITAAVAGTTTLSGGNIAYNYNNNVFTINGAITLTSTATITKLNGAFQMNFSSGTLNGGGQTLNIFVDTTTGTNPIYFQQTAGTSLGQINILNGAIGQDSNGGLPLRNAAMNIANGAQFRTFITPTINNNITLNGGAGPDGNGALWSQSVTAAHTAIYTGTITLAAGTNSSAGNTTSALWITGKITGAGSFTKVGAGILSTFGVANDYTGSTTISAGTLRVLKPFGAVTPTASFTATTLSVSFSGTPTAGMTFRFFQGTTTNTYASVTLVGAPGRTGVYTSANSTLTIA